MYNIILHLLAAIGWFIWIPGMIFSGMFLNPTLAVKVGVTVWCIFMGVFTIHRGVREYEKDRARKAAFFDD